LQELVDAIYVDSGASSEVALDHLSILESHLLKASQENLDSIAFEEQLRSDQSHILSHPNLLDAFLKFWRSERSKVQFFILSFLYLTLV
jgi:hypothetical protein